MHIEDWQQRWGSLAPREQKLLLAGAGAVLVLVLWAAVLRPLYDYHQSLHGKVATLTQQLQWMQEQAPKLVGKTTSSLPAQGTPAEIASALARQLGIPIARVQPKGTDAVTLWIDEVPADKLLQWVVEIRKKGLNVTNAQISKVADGILRATLTLSGGG